MIRECIYKVMKHGRDSGLRVGFRYDRPMGFGRRNEKPEKLKELRQGYPMEKGYYLIEVSDTKVKM